MKNHIHIIKLRDNEKFHGHIYLEIMTMILKLMNMPSMSDKWDIVHFEQLMWYWNSSKEIEDYCGNIINGILFMHIPPWEFQYIVDNPIVTKCTGSTKEIMKIGCLIPDSFLLYFKEKTSFVLHVVIVIMIVLKELFAMSKCV